MENRMIVAAIVALQAATLIAGYTPEDTAVIGDFTSEQGKPVNATAATTKQLVFLKFNGKLYPETLAHLNHLESLILQDGNIDEIKPGALCSAPKLQHVVLDSLNTTGVTEETFEGCGELRHLEIRYRDFPVAPSAFQDLEKLETLETAQFSWGELRKSSFAGLENLKQLSITDGNVSKIEPGAFEELENLQRLTLSNNELPGVNGDEFRGLSNLTHLNVDANPLTMFDIDAVLRKLPKLKNLIISYALLPDKDWEYIQNKVAEAGIVLNHYE